MIWPYRILERNDDEIKADLIAIMEHFKARGRRFDMVVFVPNAGTYLGTLFRQIYDGTIDVQFITARRASTVAGQSRLKTLIFKSRYLADVMRHIDVLWRLIKYGLGVGQKMVAETEIRFDVKGKNVLVIDDDIATGTTLQLIKETLTAAGAASVTMASISNHFLPNKIKVDYSVYEYALLRTRNSRDYDAGRRRQCI